jgi:hypothetical protein
MCCPQRTGGAGHRTLDRDDRRGDGIDRIVDVGDGLLVPARRLHQDLGIGGRREDQLIAAIPRFPDGAGRSLVMDILPLEQRDHHARIEHYRSHSSRNARR